MRLWSLHPNYLDSAGLIAVWREALLAQAVLAERTKGYRHHPQLLRFRAHPEPLAAMGSYLQAVWDESVKRGYSFDRKRVISARSEVLIPVSSAQMDYEWAHLSKKMARRNPAWLAKWPPCPLLEPHPLFASYPGPIEAWERTGSDV